MSSDDRRGSWLKNNRFEGLYNKWFSGMGNNVLPSGLYPQERHAVTRQGAPTARPAPTRSQQPSGITTNRRFAMFRQSKFRQAGLILFATTVLLILPNLTRLFG
jgi:hypothetical protein